MVTRLLLWAKYWSISGSMITVIYTLEELQLNIAKLENI